MYISVLRRTVVVDMNDVVWRVGNIHHSTRVGNGSERRFSTRWFVVLLKRDEHQPTSWLKTTWWEATFYFYFLSAAIGCSHPSLIFASSSSSNLFIYRHLILFCFNNDRDATSRTRQAKKSRIAPIRPKINWPGSLFFLSAFDRVICNIAASLGILYSVVIVGSVVASHFLPSNVMMDGPARYN